MNGDLGQRRPDRNPLNASRITLADHEREALVAARRRRKIRIKLLARQLGVSPSTLLKWQAGHRRPQPGDLDAWREAVL